MNALRERLLKMEGIKERSKQALVKELAPYIIFYQGEGYELEYIHKTINETIVMKFLTFRSAFYRARSEGVLQGVNPDVSSEEEITLPLPPEIKRPIKQASKPKAALIEPQNRTRNSKDILKQYSKKTSTRKNT